MLLHRETTEEPASKLTWELRRKLKYDEDNSNPIHWDKLHCYNQQTKIQLKKWGKKLNRLPHISRATSEPGAMMSTTV